MPNNPHKTPCSIPGCRAWAIRGSDPPLCSPHTRGKVGAPLGNQNHLVHGFYATVLHPQELADLATYAANPSLDDEIAITRVALRRILAMLLTGFTPGPEPLPLDAQDYARFAGLAFQGAATLSRLLRARHILQPGDDPIETFFDKVLDELGAEWGIDL